MILPECLAGHFSGHQEMSECFCSYFRQAASVCGQFSRLATVAGN